MNITKKPETEKEAILQNRRTMAAIMPPFGMFAFLTFIFFPIRSLPSHANHSTDFTSLLRQFLEQEGKAYAFRFVMIFVSIMSLVIVSMWRERQIRKSFATDL
jgi:hypothetical protein